MPLRSFWRKNQNSSDRTKDPTDQAFPSHIRLDQNASQLPTVKEVLTESALELSEVYSSDQSPFPPQAPKSSTRSKLPSFLRPDGALKASSRKIFSTSSSRAHADSTDQSTSAKYGSIGSSFSLKSSVLPKKTSGSSFTSFKSDRSQSPAAGSGLYGNDLPPPSRISAIFKRGSIISVPLESNTLDSPPIMHPESPKRVVGLLRLGRRRPSHLKLSAQQDRHESSSIHSAGNLHSFSEEDIYGPNFGSLVSGVVSSRTRSVRSMHNSNSQRSLEQGVLRSSDTMMNDWNETDSTIDIRRDSENSFRGPKFRQEQNSPASNVTDTLFDIPPIRFSTDTATPRSSYSSPVKVAFDPPAITVTQPEFNDPNIANSAFTSFQLDPSSKLEAGTTSSSIVSFPLLPDSMHADSPTPSSEGQLTNTKHRLRSATFSALPPSTSQHAPRTPPLHPSSRKGPLVRLRQKTASMFLNSDVIALDLDPESSEESKLRRPKSFVYKSSSPNAFSASGKSPLLFLDNEPFPLVRSYSNQNLTLSASSELPAGGSEDITNKSVPSRHRSRTLSSIEPRIKHSHPFAKPSLSGLFSGRRADLFSLPLNSPTQQSSSPTPSISGRNSTSIALPPRENETPASYLAKVRDLGLGSYTIASLSKKNDEFHKQVMKLDIAAFSFTDYPLDMALRKFLMSVALPSEAQQIDRVLEAFAFRYHECNPTIYPSVENAYIVAYSLLILHTDAFNMNNKCKMQQIDYIKNTEKSSATSKDILSVSTFLILNAVKLIVQCFYDNITYTHFIKTDDDLPMSGHLSKTSNARRASTFGRVAKDVIDPYALLLEGRLDTIRPNLECLSFEDFYSYLPIPSKEVFYDLRRRFENGNSLKLISHRSRPGAFKSSGTMENTASSGPGVVDIKVVKAGFLHKAEGKRKNVWKEWGVILTVSQLYFFKDTTWFRNNIINQQADVSIPSDALKTTPESVNEVDNAQPDATATHRFTDGFVPSSVISTTDMVALLCEDEPRQQGSFLLASKGGTTEWYSGPEADIMDWMLKINFAAAFHTFFVASISHSLTHRILGELESRSGVHDTSSSSLNPLKSEISKDFFESVRKLKVDHFSRKYNIEHKLGQINTKLSVIDDQLEEHKRVGRHLKLLAPIQQRTREAVFLAAATLTAVLKWKWLERRKLLCYKEYFEMDHLLESEICASLGSMVLPDSTSKADEVLQEDRLQPPNEASNVSLGSIKRITHRRVASDNSFFSSRSGMKKNDVQTASSSIYSAGYYNARSSYTASINSVLVEPLATDGSLTQLNTHSETHSNTPLTPVKRSRSYPHGRSASLASDMPPSVEVPLALNRMPLTLRLSDTKRKAQKLAAQEAQQPPPDESLLRKEGEKITIYGHKFKVVEVNPELAKVPSCDMPGAHDLDEDTSINVWDNPKLIDPMKRSREITESFDEGYQTQ